MKKKYEIDMCNGPILKKMLAFALPLMLSSVLQLFFNAADIIVVGRWSGDNALAAVGSTSSLINLLTNFFMGFSIGANVLVARYFGAKKEGELSRTVHTAMLLSLFSGIAVTIIGIVGAKQILIWMKSPEDVLELSATYLRIYFLGMTSTMIYNFGSAILRAVGDTKRPLYYLFFAGIVNVMLNLIFVIGFGMGVAGVAIATAVSQTISAVLVVRCMLKSTGAVQLVPDKLKLDKEKTLLIVKIGLPASIQSIIFSFSNVIIQSSVNSFGPTVMAGNSAAANIEGFVYVAMNAFYQSAMSFTSQNLGAAKYERINKILICAEGCVLVVGLVLGNMVQIFGRPLIGLYTQSSLVVDAGMVRLGVIARMYALCGMMDVVVGSLRGLGYSIMPMLVSLVGACGLRMIWIFTLFQMEAFHTTRWLYLTYPISWTITMCAHIICFVIIRKRMNKKLGMA